MAGYITVFEITSVAKQNVRTLFIIPIASGLLALAAASALPKYYTSVAYLKLSNIPLAEVAIRSNRDPVVDITLTKISIVGETAEARRKFLNSELRVFVQNPPPEKNMAVLRVDVTDRDPRSAQKINAAFIDSWIDNVKPIATVFEQPSVPSDASYPNRWRIVFLTIAISEMVAVLFVLLRAVPKRTATVVLPGVRDIQRHRGH